MLETDSDSNRSKNSEEDDIGCYFLQPSSSPYNITEKVQKANLDLFNSSRMTEKTAKVKFKDDLVSFEPELTDDDVNSIESDQVEPTLPPIINSFLEPLVKEQTNCGKKIFKNEDSFKVNYNNVVLEEIEEINDEIIEDDLVEEEYIEDEEEVIEDNVLNEENFDLDVKVSQNTTPVKFATPDSKKSKHSSSKSSKKSSKTTKQSTKSNKYCSEIHCKDHCIEKIDHSLSMSIKKLEIHEKSFNLPPLQLHQRKCCEDHSKNISNTQLPNYNGYRSEYGLTCRQLERRRKQLEVIRQKEVMRQHLIEEFKNRKTQQNERVFCQWLKDVSKRKTSGNNMKTNTKNYCLSPQIAYTATNNMNKNSKLKDRPKTANDFIPKTSVKKKVRPHTTHSCVYIEVPQNILEKGVQIGDLLISNSKLFSKKIHILAMS